jgi:hypothetical protein
MAAWRNGERDDGVRQPHPSRQEFISHLHTQLPSVFRIWGESMNVTLEQIERNLMSGKPLREVGQTASV